MERLGQLVLRAKLLYSSSLLTALWIRGAPSCLFQSRQSWRCHRSCIELGLKVRTTTSGQWASRGRLACKQQMDCATWRTLFVPQ
ncbi:hypothetical protein B0O80DRAFT_309471 [Mortierella sp. GBAus27b]|nr:hypothetical protein B0O80DRAFT_309471 [Mortierella sp. GBAus27b]